MSNRSFRIATSAVVAAAGIVVAVIIFATGGGSTNIAFGNVADALDSLRSATYDVTSEAKGEKDQPAVTATGKGFFLAPSHQRMEISVDIAKQTMSPGGQPGEHVTIPKYTIDQVTIVDGQAAKYIMLTPNLKLAVAMDMKKMQEDKRSGNGAPPDLFEMVRRLVREGSSGTGEEVERLGKKQIDEREAVGFRIQSEMSDLILWADPKTAWPIRIEISGEMFTNVHTVMSNFRYNVDLDPSLFSLEPPEGYSTQAMEMTMPVEEDLLSALRTIAERSKGLFPAKLGMNKEVMESLGLGGEVEFKVDELTQDKLDAEMDRIAAKYGGREKLREEYGKELPPEIMAEFMKASAPIMQEQVKKRMPLVQKQIQQAQGITFYAMLQPENDPHYVGGGVKLGTPDCPILWYKPTGADKYRVIYADLSVKDMAPDDVKKLPEAKAK